MWGGGVFNFPRKHADVRIIEILLCGLYVIIIIIIKIYSAQIP